MTRDPRNEKTRLLSDTYLKQDGRYQDAMRDRPGPKANLGENGAFSWASSPKRNPLGFWGTSLALSAVLLTLAILLVLS